MKSSNLCSRLKGFWAFAPNKFFFRPVAIDGILGSFLAVSRRPNTNFLIFWKISKKTWSFKAVCYCIIDFFSLKSHKQSDVGTNYNVIVRSIFRKAAKNLFLITQLTHQVPAYARRGQGRKCISLTNIARKSHKKNLILHLNYF